MGKGIKTLAEHFSWERKGEVIERVYGEVLGKGRRGNGVME